MMGLITVEVNVTGAQGSGSVCQRYKYNHISNGYHSSINPGVDVQMIYVGYSFRR